MRIRLTASDMRYEDAHQIKVSRKTFYLPDHISHAKHQLKPSSSDDFERQLQESGVSYVVSDGARIRISADYRGNQHIYVHRAQGSGGAELTITDDLFSFAGILPVDHAVARLVPLMRYVPTPLSIVREAERLAPGMVQTYHRSNLSTLSSGSFVVGLVGPGSDGAKRGDIRQTLAAIVADRAQDVSAPVVFLSGGTDSALLVYLLKQHGVGPEAWTAVFDTNVGRQEASLASQTAAYYDIGWHSSVIDKGSALQHLPTILDAMKEPFADVALVAEAVLALTMRREIGDPGGAIPVFEGEGMDAVMCGSYRFVAERYRRWLSPLLALAPAGRFDRVDRRSTYGAFKLKIRQAKALLQSGGSVFDRHLRYFEGDDIAAHVPSRLREKVAAGFRFYYDLLPDLDDLNRLAVMTFLGNNANLDNRKLAVVAACAGIDFRLIYQDPRFVRLALSIPAKQKLGMGFGKRVVKNAFRTDLPPHTLTRRKSNFVPPVFDWIYPDREDLFFSSDLFEQDEIRRRIQEHTERRQDHLAFLWGLLVTNAWIRKYETRASRSNFRKEAEPP
jgi:asparagine synthase (glutamine-hydrolysing)